MLYGTHDFVSSFLENANRYADEHNYQIIFAALVGSISKGIQYPDSDYDTRVLYLDRDKFIINHPWKMKEADLKKREYFDEQMVPYEFIPFWEATSFFQFIKNPSFDGVFSSGLYNIIGWTLQSPYTYDPYGLANRVMPLINQVFRLDWYIPYHRTMIEKKYDRERIEYCAKDYMDIIYSALVLDWAQKNHSFPPIYMETLAEVLLEGELKDGVLAVKKESQNLAKNIILCTNSNELHTTSVNTRINSNIIINDYVEEVIGNVNAVVRTTDFNMDMRVEAKLKIINNWLDDIWNKDRLKKNSFWGTYSLEELKQLEL